MIEYSARVNLRGEGVRVSERVRGGDVNWEFFSLRKAKGTSLRKTLPKPSYLISTVSLDILRI